MGDGCGALKPMRFRKRVGRGDAGPSFVSFDLSPRSGMTPATACAYFPGFVDCIHELGCAHLR